MENLFVSKFVLAIPSLSPKKQKFETPLWSAECLQLFQTNKKLPFAHQSQ